MRKFRMSLLMIAVATASFAVGRSTSGYAPSVTLASRKAAPTEGPQAQSVSRNPPHIESDAPALEHVGQSSSYHGYLVFPPEQ